MDEGTQAWTSFFYEAIKGEVKLPATAHKFEALLETRGLDIQKLTGTEVVPGWILGRLNLPEETSFSGLAAHFTLHGLLEEFDELEDDY